VTESEEGELVCEHVWTEPTHPLDEHIAEFADETAVGVDTVQHHGHVGQSPHPCLKALSLVCAECSKSSCGFCLVGHSPSKRANNNQQWVCLMCHASDVPMNDVATDEMRAELLHRGAGVPMTATVAELQDLHEDVEACDMPHDTM